MAFSDSLRTLANQIEERRRQVVTEEAVKQALILPFLSLLGFDIWNPAELIPEYRAGWAKNNEKIDYCLQIHGKAVLFVEAKGPGETLANHDAQLAKYFNSTPDLKFAIITNGVQHRFFTDLQEPNLLDKKPFFEFNFEGFTDADIAVLERFRKDVFSVDSLVSYAEDLVFLGTLKNQFKRLLREPSDEFISFAVKEAHIVDTRVTAKVIERFRPLVKESISAAVLEIVQQSLLPQAAALETVAAPSVEEGIVIDGKDAEVGQRVVTTEEEREAFAIVKEIVGPHVPNAELIKARDTESYFAVMYNVTTRWFVRFYVQDREKKIAVVRLETAKAQALCPHLEWSDAPGGGSRIFLERIGEIDGIASALIAAAKGVAE